MKRAVNKKMKFYSLCLMVFLIPLFLISTAFAQNEAHSFPIDSSTHKITYTEVVYLDSLTDKQEIFSRAREWFASTYKSSINVIQMDDKEGGKIVGKAQILVEATSIFGQKFDAGYINYTIKVFAKDGRYKYEITNFNHTGGIMVQSGPRSTPDGGPCEVLLEEKKGFWGNSYRKTYGSYLVQTDENIRQLIANLKIAMAVKTKKNDW